MLVQHQQTGILSAHVRSDTSFRRDDILLLDILDMSHVYVCMLGMQISAVVVAKQDI